MAYDESLNTPVSRSLFWLGVAACLLFALGAVFLRGVRWDETWEHAEIIAGHVTYPDGHPLAVYVHNAFSLQTYLSAALVKLGAGPAFLCGLRNFLFLLASMLPVYAITTLLSRSVLAGLLATLLVLQGIMLEFDGSYPTMVWPELYSNGHIGGGMVLLALAALLARAHRSAWFLLGLIPCIHLGQWPPLAATMALYALALLFRTRKQRAEALPAPPWTTCAAMAMLGFGGTLLFYLIQQRFAVSLPAGGPFAVGGDVAAVWQGYTAFHDPHRQFPPGNGQVILAGTLLLASLGALYGRDNALRTCCLWLAVYCAVVAAIVWGTMMIHAFYGHEMPFLLIAWMPYRLINHMPPLALALMVALIVVRWPIRGWWIVGGAALAGLLLPFAPTLLDPELARRYVTDGAWIAFGLFGAALLAIAPSRRSDRRKVTVLALLAIAPFAAYHRFGATCVVLGLVAAFLISRRATREPIVLHPILLVPALLLIAGGVGLLKHQYQYREHLPRSSFDRATREALIGQEGVLLLAPPDSIRLQALTGMPVLAEAATPSLISYVPALGPIIDALYHDVYGYGFAATAADDPDAVPWGTVWQARSRTEWEALASAWGFTHVVAPTNQALDLSRVLVRDDYTLYAIRE